MKVCTNCGGAPQSLESFSYHPSTKDHRQSWCKKCVLAAPRNQERYRKYVARPAPLVKLSKAEARSAAIRDREQSKRESIKAARAAIEFQGLE